MSSHPAHPSNISSSGIPNWWYSSRLGWGSRCSSWTDLLYKQSLYRWKWWYLVTILIIVMMMIRSRRLHRWWNESVSNTFISGLYRKGDFFLRTCPLFCLVDGYLREPIVFLFVIYYIVCILRDSVIFLTTETLQMGINLGTFSNLSAFSQVIIRNRWITRRAIRRAQVNKSHSQSRVY
jgi:hypothetical protein